jgi:Aerotolerance regulator N-terminal
MSIALLAPGFMVAGVVAAIGVIGLHFIVMRQPPSGVFPTVRFLPARPAVARTIARVPEDLLLLLARALALLLIGAAFARPVLRPHRASILHIVMVDRSRAVRDIQEVADSARTVMSGTGTGPALPVILVLFDSAARTVEGSSASDALVGVRPVEAPGNASGGFVAALRAAAQWRGRADSVDLTVVSPLVGEEVDAATDSIRALWPAVVRLVRVGARNDSSGARPTIVWPADGHARGAVARRVVDTIGGVVIGKSVIVAPFVRRWGFDTAARVLARWVDGEPAAVERVVGTRCEHAVAVPVPADGDLVLRSEWRRLVDVVGAPCGRGVVDVGGMVPVPWKVDSARAWRVGTDRIVGAETRRSAIVLWLLVAGLVMLLVEPVVRRGTAPT